MLRNPDVQNVSVASMCEVICEGNAVYDNLDTTNLLSIGHSGIPGVICPSINGFIFRLDWCDDIPV